MKGLKHKKQHHHKDILPKTHAGEIGAQLIRGDVNAMQYSPSRYTIYCIIQSLTKAIFYYDCLHMTSERNRHIPQSLQYSVLN